ncbi:hypothetical protein CJ483_02405 [Bacillus sp. PK3_68]|nr:hypothetical protein CJ483_02405 [Bacillus sp. PK3_68]
MVAYVYQHRQIKRSGYRSLEETNPQRVLFIPGSFLVGQMIEFLFKERVQVNLFPKAFHTFWALYIFYTCRGGEV